jgi:hypothetical protein
MFLEILTFPVHLITAKPEKNHDIESFLQNFANLNPNVLNAKTTTWTLLRYI